MQCMNMVCVSSACVCWTQLCAVVKGWTNQDSVWVMDSGGTKEPDNGDPDLLEKDTTMGHLSGKCPAHGRYSEPNSIDASSDAAIRCQYCSNLLLLTFIDSEGRKQVCRWSSSLHVVQQTAPGHWRKHDGIHFFHHRFTAIAIQVNLR